MKPIFAQLRKVDEEKRLIYARAVQEVPDRADEIFDYETSKPYFKEWSDEIFDASGGKSYGNVRAMHGKQVAGKVAEPLQFVDEEKAIDVVIKVLDDEDWKKTIEGGYTGVSIGGSYVGERKTEKIADREVRRYTARPSEISLVDSPCIPTAKFFEVVKADGSAEQVAFREPVQPEPAPMDVVGTDDEVAAFAKALNDAGMSMADAIAAVQAEAAKRAPAPETPPVAPAEAPLDKGLWNHAQFASLLEGLAMVTRSAQMDADLEGDNSPVPAKLRAAFASLVECYKEMGAEEADELVAELAEDAAEGAGEDALEGALQAAAKVGALQKRLADPDLPAEELLKLAAEHAEPLGDLATLRDRIVAKAGAGHMDALQKAHDILAGVGTKCMKEASTAADKLAKAHASELAVVVAKLEAAEERIRKLEAQPVPYVTLRTVAKTTRADAAPSAETPATAPIPKADYIYRPDGSVDWHVTQMIASSRARANN